MESLSIHHYHLVAHGSLAARPSLSPPEMKEREWKGEEGLAIKELGILGAESGEQFQASLLVAIAELYSAWSELVVCQLLCQLLFGKITV